MPYRQFLRLTALTAFAFFIYTSAIHAQGKRKSVLYDAAYMQGGKISGKITGNSGPMKGVRVSLIDRGDILASVVTGDNGVYHFDDIVPGRYEISCFKKGFRKRIINRIPVLENHLTNNDLSLSEVKNLKEERNPKIDYYEDLENHKLEKI